MTHTDTPDATVGAAAPVDGAVRRAAPPPSAGDDLLARIEATVAAIADKLSPVPQLERSLRRWRVSFFLLGVISTGIVALGLHVALPVVRGADAVATLAAPAGEPAFLVALTADGHDLIVRRLAAAPAAGQPAQLWLARDGADAAPLGRLADGEATRLPRPAGLASADFAKLRFIVSLTPPGAAQPAGTLYAGRPVPITP